MRAVDLESVNASAWLVYEAEEAGVQRLQAVQARQQGDAGERQRQASWIRATRRKTGRGRARARAPADGAAAELAAGSAIVTSSDGVRAGRVEEEASGARDWRSSCSYGRGGRRLQGQRTTGRLGAPVARGCREAGGGRGPLVQARAGDDEQGLTLKERVVWWCRRCGSPGRRVARRRMLGHLPCGGLGGGDKGSKAVASIQPGSSAGWLRESSRSGMWLRVGG